MATVKKVTDDSDLNELFTSPEPGLTDSEVALSDILGELGADESGKITLYRTSKKPGGVGGFLFSCTPTEYAGMGVLEKLRDEYGGGEFRAVVRVDGVTRANKLLIVEAPAKDSFGFLNKSGQTTAQPTGTDQSSNFMALQESIRASSDQMREMMFAMQQENNKMMLEIVKASANTKTEGPSMIELVQTLAAMKQLSPPEEKGAGPEKLLDMFFKGMEQGKSMAQTDNGDESILQTAIKTIGPSLGDMAKALAMGQAQGQNPNPNQPVQRPLGLPRPTNPAVAAPFAQTAQTVVPNNVTAPVVTTLNPEPEQDMNLIAMMQMQPYINILMTAALRDASTEVYANMILDQFPEETVQEMVGDQEKFDKLLSYFPAESKNHMEWFDELRENVLTLLDEENAPEENDAPLISSSTGAAPIPNPTVGDATPDPDFSTT